MKKHTTPQGEVSKIRTQQMPTPYELARIAAALGREAVKKPAQAAKDALALWVACRAAIDALTREFERQQFDLLQRPSNPDEVRLSMIAPDDNEERIQSPERIAMRNCEIKSPVLDWINENAEDDLDRFKTFGSFKKAWLKYDPREAWFSASRPIYELTQFLDWRRKQRQKDDAERQRIKRQQKKGAPKGMSNKTEKIPAGRTAKSKHEKQ